MRALLQRVSTAHVDIAGERVDAINRGLLIFLGIAPHDTAADADWLAAKITTLRIFDDAGHEMNLSVRDIAGQLLIISQFTLYARTRKGTRPSWNGAARPEIALPLYETFLRACASAIDRPVASGRFGANMHVSLVNDGPITLLLDSHQRD
ncbi:MAG: D-tyrosyl-tRNA(Tyr) deacylase [Opitutaceae bacterium]|jgi:D-tyrosyl-tRNA(Tyr) deacylase|nr:D-tyrosyl-tRNA(Tyr) deacylase [Opitutaceae bacterium]